MKKVANSVAKDAPPEKAESLWLLISAPTIWAIHFLACYLTASVWCEKIAGDADDFAPVRWAFGVYTLFAVVGILAIGWISYCRIRNSLGDFPHDADHPGDRHRFLGFATFLLCWLSLTATLFVAAVALFMETCR